MKQTGHLQLAVVLSTALFCLPSCSKIFDDKQRPDKAADCCRIEALYVESGYGPPQHILFSYDPKGELVKLEAQDPKGFQYFAFHLRYDSKGRVTDYQFTDAFQTFVYIWHHYTYPTPATMVDSEYEYAGHTTDPNPPYETGTKGYAFKTTLDEKGRPVNYTQIYNPVDTTLYRETIQYGANGNLISPGAVYDDKVNILRTTPAFQLIYRNYSRNNLIPPVPSLAPAYISDYNQFGLPLQFNYQANIFEWAYIKAVVTYSCDTTTKKDL